VPGILNLSVQQLTDDTPETLNELYANLREATGPAKVTFWKRIFGTRVLAVSEFADLETLNEAENKFIMSSSFREFVAEGEAPEDIDRFEIIYHQGVTHVDVPIDGYCSTNHHVAAPGHVSDELNEAKYILDSLWLIEGFLGAYIGRSLISPSRLDSLAFWSDVTAAEKAIPIRVNTNLRMYRRLA